MKTAGGCRSFVTWVAVDGLRRPVGESEVKTIWFTLFSCSATVAENAPPVTGTVKMPEGADTSMDAARSAVPVNWTTGSRVAITWEPNSGAGGGKLPTTK